MWGFWGEGCPPRQRRSGPWCEWASPVQLVAVSTSNPCHFEFMTSTPHLYTLVQSSFCRKDPSWSLSSWSAFPARLTQLSPSLSSSLCKVPPTPQSFFPCHSHELDTQLCHNIQHTAWQSPPCFLRLELVKVKLHCWAPSGSQGVSRNPWFSAMLPELTLEERVGLAQVLMGLQERIPIANQIKKSYPV